MSLISISVSIPDDTVSSLGVLKELALIDGTVPVLIDSFPIFLMVTNLPDVIVTIRHEHLSSSNYLTVFPLGLEEEAIARINYGTLSVFNSKSELTFELMVVGIYNNPFSFFMVVFELSLVQLLGL